ncbi:MAG: FkbM family methyltransferase [Acidobacteriota bacterium]
MTTPPQKPPQAPTSPPSSPGLETSAPFTRHPLPNGLEVATVSRAELAHFYDDIFVKCIYTAHGITLPDEPVVFDVGANIGLFSLFVARGWPRAQVFAFEPAPPIFAALDDNLSRLAPRARRFNVGVSDQPGEASFTFYPQASGMSSFYADVEEEKRALKAVLQGEARKGVAEVEQLLEHVDEYLDERLQQVDYTCRLTTLKAVLEDHPVPRIDLLKVDVQKAEEQVLAGLGEEHWPKVRQLVLEVHDVEGRCRRLTELLRQRGFQVTAVQDEYYERSEMYNLYALRPAAPATDSGRGLQGAAQRAQRQRQALRGRPMKRPARPRPSGPSSSPGPSDSSHSSGSSAPSTSSRDGKHE